MPFYQEPLDAALWFKRVDLIATGRIGSLENALRHASHLLELTPQELRPVVGLAIDPESFEKLLECGDFDSASRHLVGRPEALSIEGEDGADIIRATIQCSALNSKVHGTGDTLAKALLNAWSGCLLRLKARYGEDLSGLVRQFSVDERQSSVFFLAERNHRRTTASEETSAKDGPEPS